MGSLSSYILFAIVGLILLMLLPPVLTPMLGGVFGAYTTYVVTALILILLYWISKKTARF